MMARQVVNLEKLAEAQAAALAAEKVAEALAIFEPEPPQAVGRSLTVKLNGVDYWRLRDYCAQQERRTGRRLTHQDAMVMALHKLLEAEA